MIRRGQQRPGHRRRNSKAPLGLQALVRGKVTARGQAPPGRDASRTRDPAAAPTAAGTALINPHRRPRRAPAGAAGNLVQPTDQHRRRLRHRVPGLIAHTQSRTVGIRGILVAGTAPHARAKGKACKHMESHGGFSASDGGDPARHFATTDTLTLITWMAQLQRAGAPPAMAETGPWKRDLCEAATTTHPPHITLEHMAHTTLHHWHDHDPPGGRTWVRARDWSCLRTLRVQGRTTTPLA